MQHLASAPVARGLWILVLLVAGCAAPPASEAPPPAPPSTAAPQPATAPAAAPPAVAAPFADAVARAGDRLLQDALATLGNAPRDLVIDPLIDASTGQQTNGTVQMGAQLAGLITRRVPAWNVQPLTRAALASQPLLLIGTLTAINTKKRQGRERRRVPRLPRPDRPAHRQARRQAGRPRNARERRRRAAAALPRQPDLGARYDRAGLHPSRARAAPPATRSRPTTCGVCRRRRSSTRRALAFADNKPADAYRLYHEASTVAAPDDLRVLNGLYATSWKTGRKKEAAETFGKIVDLGLESKQLPIKIFFNPGTTTLLQSADLQAQYAVWLQQVAMPGRRRARAACASSATPAGPATPAANEVLSQKRAAVIKQSLERQNKKLAPRIAADGVGSREIIVGLGTDDLRDALDRRVEFRTVDCS